MHNVQIYNAKMELPMRKFIFSLFIVSASFAFTSSASAGQCYWVCSNGQWVPIKQGVCIMPLKPVRLCPLS